MPYKTLPCALLLEQQMAKKDTFSCRFDWIRLEQLKNIVFATIPGNMNIKKDCVTNDDAIKSEEREKYH